MPFYLRQEHAMLRDWGASQRLRKALLQELRHAEHVEAEDEQG